MILQYASLLSCRRVEVRMEGGVGTLTIFGARAIDNGGYSCEVVSALHGTQLSLNSTNVNITDGTFHCKFVTAIAP